VMDSPVGKVATWVFSVELSWLMVFGSWVGCVA